MTSKASVSTSEFCIIHMYTPYCDSTRCITLDGVILQKEWFGGLAEGDWI